MQISSKRQKLNDIVVTIELTLLSVIQGVALYFFADNVRGPILTMDYEHWIYIILAFIIYIIFWSQALVHVLTFISWPLEFIHNFLYFIIVAAEVLMFVSITNPVNWYATNALFFFVSWILYYVDTRLLEDKAQYFDSPEQKSFYEMLIKDQYFSFHVLVPVGFLYSLIAWLLTLFYPVYFLDNGRHLDLAGVQAVIFLGTFFYLLSVFKKHLNRIEFL
jgi:hypothetical protein